MTKILAILACLSLAAAAGEPRWLTFKTEHDEWGRILHQIDRASIRQEGPYRTFWTRVWIDSKKQPMVFSDHESLIFLSRKFAVDCVQHRFGARFIDSNDPREKKHAATMETMRWQKLDAMPAVARAVCGS
ncbi:MAG TPA: hypothetical protein VFI23_01755 [Rhizomicrobium sp.]|nr:hypothetical protein [Rhizomicrobium sp.]